MATSDGQEKPRTDLSCLKEKKKNRDNITIMSQKNNLTNDIKINFAFYDL